MEFRDLFLKQNAAIRKRTVEVLDLIRPQHMGWKPEKDALSVGETLQHLWRSEEGVRRVALENNFAYYEVRVPQGLRSTLGDLRGLEENVVHLERVHRDTQEQVAAYPVEGFEEERVREDLKFRRKVYIILLGINEHQIHHCAQLMTYLRILGTPVPEVTRR